LTAFPKLGKPSFLGVCCASRPKSEKTRVFARFLPLKLRRTEGSQTEGAPRQAIYRGFHGFFQRKNHENLQAQQAASAGACRFPNAEPPPPTHGAGSFLRMKERRKPEDAALFPKIFIAFYWEMVYSDRGFSKYF
jgi:hypothetical protein